ncbi:unnamed protein product [Triticum turgidum subsp. durum]|uniref:KIB1-4 beta-propeller domain-containing protein n=1 Tax=Triticum turgidum subsp. durum TaxID=4567 RepID=A0A9R0Z9M2_TRITD|nr:unnamed protein product [Triticum turgidum subsp. durum]
MDIFCSHASTKWRDWAKLCTDLAKEISNRLLTFDIADYIRFRATCKPWRDFTDDPRTCDAMDIRFRPRNWITLAHCASPSRRTLLNVTTGARTNIDFPDLDTHHFLSTADGLLVLGHKRTNTIRLLHPFTGKTTEFPSHCAPSTSNRHLRVNLSAINGAGIDDSTIPSTLVISLRNGLRQVICAKPSDKLWAFVQAIDQRSASFLDKVRGHSPLTFGGRCYFTTSDDMIIALDLTPGVEPHMVCLLDKDPQLVNHHETIVYPYLGRSHDRMLIVRYLFGRNLLQEGGYNEEDIFMWQDCPSHMEVLEVDLPRRRLVTQHGIGSHCAAFVGASHTVMVSTEKFPRIISNAVYLNYHMQGIFRHFAAYCFEDKTTISAKHFLNR